MKKNLICITCPMSCHLVAELNDRGEVLQVTGNTCPRGALYAQNELTHPQRMLTSTVRIENAIHPLLPVITQSPIPKEKIFEVMKEINKLKVQAPVCYQTILLENVCDTGVNLIASRSMEKVNGKIN